jgi:hypothetical protein
MYDREYSPTLSEVSVLAPRLAPKCSCAARDVMAFRDEDGDLTCYSCGRLLRPSMARFQRIRAAAGENPLLAG